MSSSKTSTWIHLLTWTLVFAGVAAALPVRVDDPKSAPTVRIIIDYGDGVEKHFTAIPWKRDMTVLDAMNAAKASSHGITFQYTGSGAGAFLTKLDDLKNEGLAKRNWIFWVNDSMAERSFGELQLEPSDVVRWKYTDRYGKRQ